MGCFYTHNKELFLALAMATGIVAMPVFAQSSSYQPSLPRLAPPEAENNEKLAQPVALKNVPDFPTAQSGFAHGTNYSGVQRSSDQGVPKKGTALQGEAASTTLPVKTRMKLVLETAVDAKTSKPGDIFEAHVRDDLFVGTGLLLPNGSLIRGRVALVNKPRIISRAGRIGIKLDQIVTPTGEVIPIDAALEFEKGVANEKGAT